MTKKHFFNVGFLWTAFSLVVRPRGRAKTPVHSSQYRLGTSLERGFIDVLEENLRSTKSSVCADKIQGFVVHWRRLARQLDIERGWNTTEAATATSWCFDRYVGFYLDECPPVVITICLVTTVTLILAMVSVSRGAHDNEYHQTTLIARRATAAHSHRCGPLRAVEVLV